MTKEQLKKDIENRASIIVLLYKIYFSDELTSKSFDSFVLDVCENIEKQYRDENINVDKEDIYKYTKDVVKNYMDILNL